MFSRTAMGMAAAVAIVAPAAVAQVGTTLTYQGQLKSAGQVVNSPSDFRFNFYTAPTGGSSLGTTHTRLGVAVVNGLFTTTFDCGVNPYTSDRALWLQIDVRNPSNTGGWVPLSARQLMTPVPFSLATRGLGVDAENNVHIPGVLGLGTEPHADMSLTTNGNVLFDGGAPHSLLFRDSRPTGIVNTLEIGIAADAGHYSTSAGIWDTVIRNLSGNAIHFQAGAGEAAMTVTGSNTLGIGTTVANHLLTTKNRGDDRAIRMRGPFTQFEYGAALRWGDSDFVRISEPEDDRMEIRADMGIFALNTFSAPAKNFRIDHPSDPANMVLNHGCIESDQYVTLYRGNATLGADGAVLIQLPSWMRDLNSDFSYQLTSVGAPQPNLHIAAGVDDSNQFRVAGGVPGAGVSWQITGVRHDAYVRTNPLVVEQQKPSAMRGTYLNPPAFGILTPEQAAKGRARE